MTRLVRKRRWWVMSVIALVALALGTVTWAAHDSGTAEALDGAGTDGGTGTVDNPPPPTVRCRISIMLDRSGSIGNPNYGGSADYVNTMKFATAVLVSQLAGQPVDLRIGVFATRAQWLTFGTEMQWTAMDGLGPDPVTGAPHPTITFLNAIIANTPWATNTWTPPGGANTNWEAAIRHGSGQDEAAFGIPRANVLLMVTDGEPTVLGWPGNNTPNSNALAAARDAADDMQRPFVFFPGTRIIGLGIGSAVNNLAFAGITSSHIGGTTEWAYVNGVAFGNLLTQMSTMTTNACGATGLITTGGDVGEIQLAAAATPARPFPGQAVSTTYTITNPSSTPISGVTLDAGDGAGARPLSTLTDAFGNPLSDTIAAGGTVTTVQSSVAGTPGAQSVSAEACYTTPDVSAFPGAPTAGRPCATATVGYTVRPFQYLPT